MVYVVDTFLGPESALSRTSQIQRLYQKQPWCMIDFFFPSFGHSRENGETLSDVVACQQRLGGLVDLQIPGMIEVALNSNYFGSDLTFFVGFVVDLDLVLFDVDPDQGDWVRAK